MKFVAALVVASICISGEAETWDDDNILFLGADRSFGIETGANDPRQTRNADSPDWMTAVGRIETQMVTRASEGSIGSCSGSLVKGARDDESDLVLTAGHCLQQWVMNDGPMHVNNADGRRSLIAFTRFNHAGQAEYLEREIVEVLFIATNKKNDFAFARLDQPVSAEAIQPLEIAAYDNLFHRLEAGEENAFETYAGYSNDTPFGQEGEVLTYHEDCRVFQVGEDLKPSNCVGYGGASGGPVVLTTESEGHTAHRIVAISSRVIIGEREAVVVPQSHFICEYERLRGLAPGSKSALCLR